MIKCAMRAMPTRNHAKQPVRQIHQPSNKGPFPISPLPCVSTLAPSQVRDSTIEPFKAARTPPMRGTTLS